MKKLILTVLGVFLAATVVSAVTPEVSVNVPNQKKLVEDKYIISVDIADNPGFASLQAELFYNDEVLTCEKVLPGDVLAGMLTDSNPKAEGEKTSAILSVAGINDTTKNGNLASFVFEKPKSGDPEIEFVLVELVTFDGKRIECEVVITNNYGEVGKGEIKPSSPGGSGIIIPPQTTDGEDDEKTSPPSEETDVVPEAPSVVFSDIAGHWASDYIKEAVTLGVVNGMPDGTFAPERRMTRAEFATILWNMAGKPNTEAGTSFTDIKESDWFYNQIAWAYENGYINGVSESEFNPNGNITREQAMTILYRYAGSPDIAENLENFKDKGSISNFAISAMSWAVENKIISGVSETEIAPKMSATRAQLATIIVRYLKK